MAEAKLDHQAGKRVMAEGKLTTRLGRGAWLSALNRIRPVLQSTIVNKSPPTSTARLRHPEIMKSILKKAK